jgi:hypothetical protein
MPIASHAPCHLATCLIGRVFPTRVGFLDPAPAFGYAQPQPKILSARRRDARKLASLYTRAGRSRA